MPLDSRIDGAREILRKETRVRIFEFLVTLMMYPNINLVDFKIESLLTVINGLRGVDLLSIRL